MRAVHLHDNISFTYNAEVAIHVDPMIKAHVSVYSYVFRTKSGEWSLDPMDTEIDWLLNGERVKYDGFKELYTKLYGKDKLDKLTKEVCTEAEKLIEGRVATSFSDIINDETK
ncbi:MAG: hypothetical protein GY787_04220 [Alteromonadales bacterium]|nr:hypothetical protein [Alteromonadales bacterium]